MSESKIASAFEIFRLTSRRRGEPWVFVCYLDDSDADVGRNVGLAGYYAHVDAWVEFEEKVEPVFKKYNINVLRGKDLHHASGEYKGWSPSKKRDFVEEIFAVANGLIIEGVAGFVDKGHYKKVKAEHPDGMQNLSPLGMGFASIVTEICLKSPQVDRIMSSTLSFLVESGNSNNNGLIGYLNFIRKEAVLDCVNAQTSIAFVDKKSCRAVQISDFLAFNSRRLLNFRKDSEPCLNNLDKVPFLPIMINHVFHRFDHIHTNRQNMPDSFDEFESAIDT